LILRINGKIILPRDKSGSLFGRAFAEFISRKRNFIFHVASSQFLEAVLPRQETSSRITPRPIGDVLGAKKASPYSYYLCAPI
jgi:hypothetical protein